jgi:ATP-binding cassette, subfamily B, multidrug efflux pump
MNGAPGNADRIVELDTYDERIALNGYYTDLYNKQLLEEELAEV